MSDRLASMTAGWPSVEELAEREPVMDPEVAERLSALGYVRSSYRPPPGEPRKNPRDMLETWTSISQAEMLSQRGRHDEALELARQVVDRDPHDGRAWYALSLVLRRMNRFGPAEEAVRKGLELAPTSEGYVKLAQFLLSRKSYTEFEIAIAEARRLEPDYGLIDIAEGDRWAMNGRYAEALACFRRALENDPVRAGGMARRQIAAVEARMEGQRR
jgi:tetratricopeptide (TPR) repeat protein